METALPPIYDSLNELQACRPRLEENLARLVAEGVTVDPTERVVPTTFYSAYHGLNDRGIAEQFGRIYRPAVEMERSVSPEWTNRKLRIGVLSRFFCRHTIGRLNIGTVQKLSRERFEVIVVSARQPDDPLAQSYQREADEYVVLHDQPARALAELRELELDVLFYTDVGMDPLTYSLAFARAAPVQCVTWGHPVTTGSRNMDYFISSSRLETANAQDHYTEKVVLLDDLAVYYPRPQAAMSALSRESLGFSKSDHLYGCPQTLFKIHPEFDVLLARILAEDPLGHLLLVEGRHPTWNERLRRRLQRRMGAAIERVHFLPRMSWPDFMALNALVDVLLDPIHFGGGNTSYEGLALGTPVVSWPSDFLRGRITYALYQRMGFFDCLVNSADEYANLALQIGTSRDYRQDLSQRILERCEVLFEDVSGIRQLEEFFEQAVQRTA
jgi:predicted O-linked N-acetylglucosamine transferase (SPINDLY family)